MSARIKATGLTLDVPIFLQREREPEHEGKGWAGIFRGAAFDPPRRRLTRLLDDLNFDVQEGDRLAILGRNGAGKSTLLRVLNRVYQPTSGSLQVEGSCQALLNMSLGFNGEATVRENIFLRGVAMGLRSSFLADQVEPILDFSGLRAKVGHRLRTLSAGQKMRLGFAISTSIQHDIMLMDEWVGAGDSDFMAKAKERMQNRVGGSKIVVLASHSMGLLRDICNKGIVLEGGRLVYAGDVMGSLKFYQGLMARVRAAGDAQDEGVEDSGAGAPFGAFEEIRAEGPGRFLVRGWMVDNHGVAHEGLVLEVDGGRYPAHGFERVMRPDVMRHFGLSSDACGFLARVDIPGLSSLAEMPAGLRLLGGVDTESADAELRIAPAVRAAVGRG